MQVHVIYALYDSRAPHDYRYVGRAAKPNRRLSRHRTTSENSYAGRWIRKVLREGGSVEMEIIAHVPVDIVKSAEAFYIHALIESGCRLTNTVIPTRGDLTGEVLWSKEQAEKLRWSDERRARWSARMKQLARNGELKIQVTPSPIKPVRKPRRREYGPGGAAWKCGDCELVSTAGALTNHQRATLHKNRSLAVVQARRNRI